MGRRPIPPKTSESDRHGAPSMSAGGKLLVVAVIIYVSVVLIGPTALSALGWAVLAAVGLFVVLAAARVHRRTRERHRLLGECEYQHHLLTRGFEAAGTYGNFPPADLDVAVPMEPSHVELFDPPAEKPPVDPRVTHRHDDVDYVMNGYGRVAAFYEDGCAVECWDN